MMNPFDMKIAPFIKWFFYIFAVFVVVSTALLLPLDVATVQRGYRGTGQEQNVNMTTHTQLVAANALPAKPYELPLDADQGPKAREVYQNVQVLGDLTEEQFNYYMTAITQWVSPEQGCAYCHGEEGNFAEDKLYTKIVSRRMMQMTQTINSKWQAHVQQTGVSCYTCHRGQPVPANIWFDEPQSKYAARLVGDDAGQNKPSATVALSSLPRDVFAPFIEGKEGPAIRVQTRGTTEPYLNRTSIKQTEWTYGLMMHFSQGLGVNCTYCHNSRNFADWTQASPARLSAWHGIQMVRTLNETYLNPLKPVFPAMRLGPLGDAPKANCATCHNGVYKPLYGQSMVQDYPGLTLSK